MDREEQFSPGKFLHFGSLAAIFLGMLALGWKKWCDPIVDFGCEAYSAWRMAEGDVLFRDIQQLYGPLSKLFYFTIFKLFGEPSLSLIFYANILLLAVFLFFLHLFVKGVAGGRAAWWSVALSLTLFCLASMNMGGNYNFIAPYCHETVHGTITSFIAFYFLYRHGDCGSWKSLFCAGLMLGLTLLTKFEQQLALTVSVCAYISLPVVSGREPGVKALKKAAPLIIGVLLPPLLFFLGYAAYTDGGLAIRALTSQWGILLGPSVGQNRIFSVFAGFSDPVLNLKYFVYAAALFAFPLLPALSASGRKKGMERALLTGVSAATLCVTVYFFGQQFPRIFPVIDLAVLIYSLRRYGREAAPPSLVVAAFSIFSILMLLRTGIEPKFHHYGFVLSLPSAVLMVIALFSLIPEEIERRGRWGRGFDYVALLLSFMLLLTGVKTSYANYSQRTYQVSGGGDTIYFSEGAEGYRSEVARQCSEWARANLPGDSTLAVFPTGAMINYLARKPNPTPYISLTPVEMQIYGEERVLESLESTQPNAIIVLNIDYSYEFGTNNFGEEGEYSRKITAWIKDNYLRGGELKISGRSGSGAYAVFWMRK